MVKVHVNRWVGQGTEGHEEFSWQDFPGAFDYEVESIGAKRYDPEILLHVLNEDDERIATFRDWSQVRIVDEVEG